MRIREPDFEHFSNSFKYGTRWFTVLAVEATKMYKDRSHPDDGFDIVITDYNGEIYTFLLNHEDFKKFIVECELTLRAYEKFLKDDLSD